MDDEIEWRRLRAEELCARARSDAVVILPLGALEQHGPHLPVEVDCVLVEAVAKRIAERLRTTTPAVVLPVVWVGISEHHMSFGGTVTLGFPAYAALVEGIVRSILRAGFRRIVLLNGHGGNDNALRVIVDELQPQIPAKLVQLTYWRAAAEVIGPSLEAQGELLHACEAETSMMLALRPELVDATRVPDAPQGTAAPGDTKGAGVYRWRPIAERSSSGVIGVPRAASAAKGEKLLTAIAETLARRLGRSELWAQ